MLSERYRCDGKPILRLSHVQVSQKHRIQQLIEEGQYVFETVTCTVCDSNEFESLSEKDRYGLYYPVGICIRCGLVQAVPRMTIESYEHFYNDNHRRLYVGSDKPTDLYSRNRYEAGKSTFDFVSRFLKVRGKRVLEVGCGAGAILKYFHDHGASVKGIDLSRDYLEYGRSEYQLDLVNMDLHDLSENNKYDLILYSDVLEHILTPCSHLEKIKRLLADDGMLYIRVPGVKNTQKPYLCDFLRSLQNAHVYYYTLTTLTNLMQRNGYSMVYGDETICSIWKHSSVPCWDIVCDYKECMKYLHKLEERWLLRYVLGLASIAKKTLKF